MGSQVTFERSQATVPFPDKSRNAVKPIYKTENAPIHKAEYERQPSFQDSMNDRAVLERTQKTYNNSTLERMPTKKLVISPNRKGAFLRDQAQTTLKKEMYDYSGLGSRSNSVQPRIDPKLKYNSRTQDAII